jgi:two-component sensor histidine kinase
MRLLLSSIRSGPGWAHELKHEAIISGPTLVLKPKTAQSLAIVLHELTTNASNMGLCRFLPVGFELNGRMARRRL